MTFVYSICRNSHTSWVQESTRSNCSRSKWWNFLDHYQSVLSTCILPLRLEQDFWLQEKSRDFEHVRREKAQRLDRRGPTKYQKILKINSVAFYWLLHDLIFSSFLVASNSRIFEILLLHLSPSTEVGNCCFFQVVHQAFERAHALDISCLVSTSLRQGAWSPLWRSQNLGPDSGSNIKLEWQNSLQNGTCQWNLSNLRRLDSNEAEVAERQQLAEVSNVSVFLGKLYSLLIIIG